MVKYIIDINAQVTDKDHWTSKFLNGKIVGEIVILLITALS